MLIECVTFMDVKLREVPALAPDLPEMCVHFRHKIKISVEIILHPKMMKVIH